MGHGIVEVGFDSALDKHLHRGQVLWIWGLTFLEPKQAVASLSAGARISFRPSLQAKTSDGRIVELFFRFRWVDSRCSFVRERSCIHG